jgi:hypothetical protein
MSKRIDAEYVRLQTFDRIPCVYEEDIAVSRGTGEPPVPRDYRSVIGDMVADRLINRGFFRRSFSIVPNEPDHRKAIGDFER